MPEVRAVRFLVFAVDDTRYRVDVEMDVIVYPFGSVPVDVAVLDNERVVASTTVSVSACGKPPDQPCLGRATLYIDLPYGVHVLEVRARDHGDDKMYPDDFISSLRPRSKWVYYFYPVIYVSCRGGTANARYITSPSAFAESVKNWFWKYRWLSVSVEKFETAPCSYPPGYDCLKYVEWDGKFIYEVNADATTESLKPEFTGFMTSRWGLEDSGCVLCIDSVYREYIEYGEKRSR